MKKALSIALFCLLVAFILGAVYVQASTRQSKLSDLEKNCQNKPSDDFASERSHGVILRDRTIGTVRLETEKNFSPPGGHIDNGETAQQALVRELKEEISITANPNKFKLYKVYCEVLGATKTQRTHVFFIGEWQGDIQIKDGDQYKWVDSEFTLNPDADSELVTLLNYLKEDNLVN